MSTNKAKLEALLKLINSAAQDAIAEYEKAGGDVPSIDSTGPHLLDNVPDNIALKAAVRTLEGAYAQLSATLAPPLHTAFNLVQGFEDACLRVAVRENITDILVKYPNGIHVNELSKIVNIDAKKLTRVLRLLATRGCYNEVDVDTFANNRLSLTLHSEHPFRYVVVHQVELVQKGATVLYETLKDPNTAYSNDPNRAPVIYATNNGGTGALFDWLNQHDDVRENFHHAMKGYSGIMGSDAFLARFPFKKYSSVVDVGGGIGAFALPLAKAHKHLKITIQDLPEVLSQARDVWGKDCPEAVQENRIEFAELDFFTQVPIKDKDIYYLRNIMHDWLDSQAAVILRNLRQALGPHSRVLIHDHVLRELSRKQAAADAAFLDTAPEPMLPNFGFGNNRMYQQDLEMLIMINSKERTLQNSLELSTAAGLKLEKVWDLVETCVLEFSAV